MTAPLPEGIDGHFGPELRRFVLAQYHQGQVTMARLLALLRAVGILISKRQLVRLLIADQDELPRRGPRCAARRARQRRLDHGGRHRRSPQSRERLLHPDRQRPLRLVRHHAIEEPRQLPRTAARRPRRLRHQCRGAGLYAPTRPRRAGDRPLGRAPGPALRRSRRLDRPSRQARHRGAQGQSRSGADRHRGRIVGQHQGAWLPARHRHRQRRCRSVQCRPARPVLGPCRASRPQARHLHR